jgi:hypothetical protein
MSTTSPGTFDPLAQSLDSLVRQGTLRPEQASELYSAAEARTPSGPIEPPPPSARWPFHDRIRAGATAFGGALALGTVLLASQLSGGEFKWSTFGVMGVITIGLAIGAAAWYVALAAVPHSRWTASVLAAFAIKSLGLTILAPWGDKDAVVYLVGLGMVALSAAGYWFLRGGAFAFSAFVGGFIVANQVAVSVIGDSDGPLMYGVIMMVYGIAIVAAGWRFECRNITGMLGAGVALFGFFVVTFIGAIAAVFVRLGNQLSSSLGETPPTGGLADMDTDLRVTFVLTLLICVALTALYAYTHYVGYLILAAIGSTQILSIAVGALAREHPLRWGTALLAGLGGLLALAALVDQARRSGFQLPGRSPGQPAPYGAPPGGPVGPPYAGPPPAGPPPAGPPYAGPPPAGPPTAPLPPEGLPPDSPTETPSSWPAPPPDERPPAPPSS